MNELLPLPGIRHVLVQNQFVTAERLGELWSQLDLRGESRDEQGLVREMVRQGEITPYLADQLLQGRTKFNLGPYRITDWIGQGGMGQVFKASHAMMGRDVAIKVLPRDKSTQDAIASFTREIRLQAKLDHPRLVRAFDAGRDGEVYFLVTEFIPGTDLRRLVRLHGRLSITQAASIIQQAAEGLAHAHQLGLVHRDIKPGNILVTPHGEAKVSDLGLAGFLHEHDPRNTKTVGTPDYISPEQIRDPSQSRAVSDIYSLGCTLYYAITGKVPFPGGRAADKVRRHLDEMPWHPRRINPEINEEFVDIVADMMEKDPERRTNTALEVVERLSPWATQSFTPAPVPRVSSWRAPPVPTDGDTVDGDVTSEADERPRAPLTDESMSSPNEKVSVPELKKREVAPPRVDRRSLWIVVCLVIPLSMLLGALLALLAVGKFV